MNDKMLKELSTQAIAEQLLSDSQINGHVTSDWKLLAAVQAQAYATLALLEEVKSQRVQHAYSNWKDR